MPINGWPLHAHSLIVVAGVSVFCFGEILLAMSATKMSMFQDFLCLLSSAQKIALLSSASPCSCFQTESVTVSQGT